MKEPPTEQQKLFWKKFNAITNIVLIVWGLVVLLYVAYKVGPDLKNFETLNHDVCALCMQKTGAICAIDKYHSANDITKPISWDGLQNLSISSGK